MCIAMGYNFQSAVYTILRMLVCYPVRSVYKELHADRETGC